MRMWVLMDFLPFIYSRTSLNVTDRQYFFFMFRIMFLEEIRQEALADGVTF